MSELNNAVLEAYRFRADSCADFVISEIFDKVQSKDVNLLFAELFKKISMPPASMSPALRNFFEETSFMPTFLDEKLIETGQHVFRRYGPEISMMLLCKSLPASYACANGAEVLLQTGNFASKDGKSHIFLRRLKETSQFVINVMSEGSFQKNGIGIRSAQHVRLMHAAVRNFILSSKNWDEKNLGKPINQEDMSGTLAAFAVLPIEGLSQIGIDLSVEEKEGYFHIWRLAGTVLGIEAELIPENYEGGLKLGNTILHRQKKESEAGKLLTKVCIDFLKRVSPKPIASFYPELFVRYLIGDEIADIVGISDYPRIVKSVAEKIILTYACQQGSSGLMPSFGKEINHLIFKSVTKEFETETKFKFVIPENLSRHWFNKTKARVSTGQIR
jgi:hypothetical protein